MLSDDFYVFVGGTGGFLLLLGAIGMMADFGTAGRDMIKPAAPFILLAAVPFFAAMGVGIFYDLRPKFRKWNIERKSEEIHLQERERELEREKREAEKTSENTTRNYAESSQQREEPSQPSPPVQDYKKQSQSEQKEEPILKTGATVPSNLQNKTSEIEPEEITEIIEKESEQEEYMRYVKRDQILRGLWYLYSSKEGFFLGQTDAARVIFEISENEKVSGSRREDIKATMNELEHYGLLTATVVKDDIKGKQLIEYKITPKGKELMKRAVDENVRRWADFVEKYKFELKKGP